MRFVKAIAAAAALTIAATAAQAVTIVQFRQNTGERNFTFDGTTLSSLSSSSLRVVLFDPDNASNSIAVDGRLTFNATAGGSAGVMDGIIVQPFSGGTFSLTADSPFTFLGQTGTNVLTGSFTGGALTAVRGGSSSTFQVSIPADSIFGTTTDFFDFTGFRLDDFALSMSSATPRITVSGGTVSSFTANGTGTFAGGVVPEPATWAMMIVGFGLVGVSLRRRERIARVSA